MKLPPGEQPVVQSALLFTNALDKVVFIDNQAFELLRPPDIGTLVGENLHDVLGTDSKFTYQLIEEGVKNKTIERVPIEILDHTAGTKKEVLLSAVATFDDDGNYIGSDITLQMPSIAESTETKIRTHADSLRALAETIDPKPEPLDKEDITKEIEYREKAELELYFTVKINTLHVLLSRVAGIRIAKSMEMVFNEAAKKNGWAVKLESGQASMEVEGINAEIYRTLLEEILNYAINVTSLRIISQEMQKLEKQINANVLATAQKYGIQSFL